jgi:hypothetical protein
MMVNRYCSPPPEEARLAGGLRPALQNSRPLPDRQPDTWPTLDLGIEYRAGAIQRIAGEQHALNTLAVPAPVLHLVEIAVVGEQ